MAILQRAIIIVRRGKKSGMAPILAEWMTITNLQSSPESHNLSQTRTRRARMHTKYSGRATVATMVGMAAIGWAGVALTVQMVLRVLA